jgi:receptor-type tyrosine-protein phosphatase gamma
MLKPKRKPLTIVIDDQPDNETESQLKQTAIHIAIENYQHVLQANPSYSSLTQDNERKILLSKGNDYLNQLLEYMESENYLQDLSYQTVIQHEALRNVMQSIFINQYDDLNEIKCRDLQSEYTLVKLLTEDQAHKDAQLELSRSLKRNNNRYNDITPYKYNAVSFKKATTPNTNVNAIDSNNTYFNASYIDGPFKMDEKCFIATQGPLQSTISKFYQMIYENDIKLVLMLCAFEEEGRKKCEHYLPHQTQSELTFDDDNEMKVQLIKEEWVIMGCLVKRELNIIHNGNAKTVQHIQMLNWPDHSEPDDYDASSGWDTLTYLIQSIAETRTMYANIPILLHCSAGTGRTGTLIAIFNLVKCLYFFKKVNYDQQVKPFFSVFNMVRRLREQRPRMVSSFEQYVFIYKFIIDFIQKNYDEI